MLIKSVTSHDGITMTYSRTKISQNNSWLVIILPFGMPVKIAETFFQYFENDYNVITWEARGILAPFGTLINKNEFAIENHVADLVTILEHMNVFQCDLVGYCSGAGIALAAVNSHPEIFSSLVLVNGDYTLQGEADCWTQFGRDVDSLFPIAASDEKTASFILDKLNNGENEGLPPGFELPFSQTHYFHRLSLNYSSYRSTDFIALARQLKLKTLVISGDKDKQCNTNSARKIKDSMNNSDIYIDPHGDHYEIVREQSNTLKIIKQYLLGQY